MFIFLGQGVSDIMRGLCNRKIFGLTVLMLAIVTFILSLNLTVLLCNLNTSSDSVTVTVPDNDIISSIDTNISNVERLKEEYDNDDVVGIIKIPGTNIDEAVMQTNDNDYYLKHSNNRDYDIHGSIYMDYRIDLSSSKKILIFGHTFPNESIDKVPFNELEKYYSYDYYKEHKNITLELSQEKRTYEIFSVYVETSDFTYMNLNFNDSDDWYNHLLKLKNNSMYNTGIDVTSDSEILILQTCSNNREYSSYEDKYLLIISRRVY